MSCAGEVGVGVEVGLVFVWHKYCRKYWDSAVATMMFEWEEGFSQETSNVVR